MKTALTLFLSLLISPFVAGAATYTMPASEQIKAPITFDIPAPKITRDGSLTKVAYKLPAELVGPDFPAIEMQTRDYDANTFNMYSSYGTANCANQISGGLQCQMKLKDLNVDQDKVEKFIRGGFADQKVAAGKVFAMRVFNGDPIGVLNY
jgi:hypothetical protein